jgi:hypothetical protein
MKYIMLLLSERQQFTHALIHIHELLHCLHFSVFHDLFSIFEIHEWLYCTM